MCYNGCCSFWCCALWGLGWWVVASFLLFTTWNKVIAALATIKLMRFWHALLIVLTLAVLCGPLCCGKYCSSSSSCGTQYECGDWECCPDSCRNGK